jgi:hypothetical protein
MEFYVGDRKVKTYSFYTGDSSCHIFKIYEKKRLFCLRYWKKVYHNEGYASPSNSEKYKIMVGEYFGKSFEYLVENSKKTRERKIKIKKILR